MAEVLKYEPPLNTTHHETEAVMIGLSDVEETIYNVRDDASPVLFLGETGTGKEVLAHRLHKYSRRADQPFVAVNVGGEEEALLLSTLFGHTKGSYTGADSKREGHFYRAGSGTILLDEIGELGKKSQVQLLRVLQERVYSPVGSDLHKKTDARVVAATNADLPAAIQAKILRLDFVNRFPIIINVPPLRYRGLKALQSLSEHFVAKANKGKEAKELTSEAMAWICNKERQWPGNVRQLESTIKFASLISKGGEITPKDLIKAYSRYGDISTSATAFSAIDEPIVEIAAIDQPIPKAVHDSPISDLPSLITLVETINDTQLVQLLKTIEENGGLKEFERKLIVTIYMRLKQLGYSRERVANALRITTRTLYSIIQASLATAMLEEIPHDTPAAPIKAAAEQPLAPATPTPEQSFSRAAQTKPVAKQSFSREYLNFLGPQSLLETCPINILVNYAQRAYEDGSEMFIVFQRALLSRSDHLNSETGQERRKEISLRINLAKALEALGRFQEAMDEQTKLSELNTNPHPQNQAAIRRLEQKIAATIRDPAR